MILKIDNLRVTFKNGITALDGVNFAIPKKSFIVILGESGSGKTTLLKTIAGLIDAREGSVFINDEDVTEIMPMYRDVAIVFQDFVLYPHMTIYENVLTGLNRFPLSEEKKDERVKQILIEFGLKNYLNFKPRHLSDGQKQRVAICKALVREPSLFLFDEPLANLDLPQRLAIRNELKEIFKTHQGSFIYVTHDIKEAESLSDHIIILKDGKVVQEGQINEIRKQPVSLDVARLIYGDELNILSTREWNNKTANNFFQNIVSLNDNLDSTIAIPYRSITIAEKGDFSGVISKINTTPNGVIFKMKFKNLNDAILQCYVNSDDAIHYQINDAVEIKINTFKVLIYKN
ncbi:MAG: ABC transporter ATP-binding protein [Bacilli bacterium]